MRKLISYTLIVFAVAFSYSCQDEDPVQLTDIIFDMSFEGETNNLVADGASKITIIVRLNPDAAEDRREVIFKTTGGLFDNGTSELKKVAERLNGDLMVKAAITMPLVPGEYAVSSEVILKDQLGRFVDTEPFIVGRSHPETISLSFDSLFSVSTNFQSQVVVKANVRNMMGNGVSSGLKVVFSDAAENAGDMTNESQFSQDTVSLNNLSTATSYYTPGLTEAGIFVVISATVLDQDGSETNLTTNKRLYIK